MIIKKVDKKIQWKDSGEKELVTFGIGEFTEGVNDQEDDEIFFWVESIDELKKGNDLGDFIII